MKTYFARGMLALLYYLFCTLITFGVMKDMEPNPSDVWLIGVVVALVLAFLMNCFIWLIENA